VQANLLAANSIYPDAVNQVFNVALGYRTTLDTLYCMIQQQLLPRFPQLVRAKLTYPDFRPVNVRHSLVDMGNAKRILSYACTHRL